MGPDNPYTLDSMRILAANYLAAGRFADALKLCKEALELTTAKLGP